MNAKVGDLVIDKTNLKAGLKLVTAVSFDIEGCWIKLKDDPTDSWRLASFFLQCNRENGAY